MLFVLVIIGGVLLQFVNALYTNTLYRNINMSAKSSNLPIDEPFKVAVVTAGAIRSFAFVERSWNRFMFSEYMYKHVYIFAHVIASRKCELSHVSIPLLNSMATELEVIWSESVVNSFVKIEKKLPKALKKSARYKISSSSTHGNFIDMWARRSRAFDMAKSYSERNSFQWDLIVFMRLDSALYSPQLDFYRWYTSLVKHESETSSKALLIPFTCRFGGTCDRFAAGLPNTMELYFQEDWIFDVLTWGFEGSGTGEVTNTLRYGVRSSDHNSEFLLQCWLYLMNISSVYPVEQKDNPISFVTLRTHAANAYCALDRVSFLYQDNSIHWTDKMTAYCSSREYFPDDLFDKESPLERCGAAYSINTTEICLTRACAC